MGSKTLRHLVIPSLLFIALAAWPTVAEAQRRAQARHRVVFGAQLGYPYGPYRYYGRLDGLTSSVRLDVTPRTAEVFVNGYRAGTVDDFDGFFQRLRLRPGEHELTVYLDGYRTLQERVYLNSGADQKIRHTMVPLPPGEPQGARPEPPVRPVPSASAPQFGSLSIRVQPVDAEIVIDGEPWTGPPTQERLDVQLSRGRHRVEVRREGYEPYTSDVDVRAGETATLNISLPRRE